MIRIAPRLVPVVTFLLLILLAPLPGLAEKAEDKGKALIEAAQQRDLVKVKELLAAGVPVDSANRYGATALFYAADKGHVEMVKTLLKAGADENVQDTFYDATPLGWSLFKMDKSMGHREIALILLARGAEPADMALGMAARKGDTELMKAALDGGKVTVDARRQTLTQLASAEVANVEAMKRMLSEGLPAEDEEAEETEAVELTAEDRARYLGEYANDQIGMRIKIFTEGDQLKAQATGQPALTMVPTKENTFVAQEVDGIEVTFSGRGGTIERFVLSQGGQELPFGRAEAEPETEVAAAPPLPEIERGPARNWPAFRGDNASGIGDGQGVPTTWDGEKGTHVRWKTPIPGIALASPVIWEDKVFVVTAASETADTTFRTGLYGDVDSVEDSEVHIWRTYALDKETGEVLWQHDASQGSPKVKRHSKSSHANPTPAVNDTHLVVLFPSEGLFCYDHSGKLLWKKELGVFGSGWFFDATYEWGFAASPIIHDGRVIVQADIYSGSYLAAWELETGELAWRTERDEIPTWSTPSILPAGEGGKAEIVTNGKTIRGYDAATGKELWTLAPNSEIVVGTPVIADGLAYVVGGYPPARPIYVVRPGGRGDLSLADDQESSEHIVWRDERGGTYIPTPLVYEGILYMFHNNGRLVAYDAKTGEIHYRKRVGKSDSFSGSPVAADGRLFFTTETGTTYVVRSGKVFAELGSNELGEVVMTTPAMSDGLMVIRGMDHVYGIGMEESNEGEREGAGAP